MLAHELGHLVLQRFIGANLPVWLNEGFAHFEGQRLMSQYLRVRLKPKGYRILNRFEPMDQARLVPLDVLTTAVDYPADPARVVDFYRQSELLVAFLHDQHGEMEPLAEFLHHQNRGLRFPAALAEVYGIDRGDRERFETAFRRYATGADQ
ncbi:hypothetical protein HQ590_15095, partial [bacterium]|nr:hypothetical protein [bacterium]